MMYVQKSFTVPTAPEKITACEACVYGRGPHASHCKHFVRRDCSGPLPGGTDITVVQTGEKTKFIRPPKGL